MENYWRIIFGNFEGVEKSAILHLQGTLLKHNDYSLSCINAKDATEEDLKSDNLIFIGSKKSNTYINQHLKSNFSKTEGYIISVQKSVFNNEKQMIIICGCDDVGILYGAVDFENKVLCENEHFDAHFPVFYFNKLFEIKFVEKEYYSSPSVKNRALWTWGYVIYDYRGYIDNMVRAKLNMLVIWNDFPPQNAKEIVDYAHLHGVKIVWGFAWGWDNAMQKEIPNLDELSENIIKTYENDYCNLGGDGIYFQSFTETGDEYIGKTLIAQAVTDLVNKTSEKLLEKYPTLHLQFGLHATSVKDKLEYIKNIDKRIFIVWEDCGAFPYNYIPKKVDGFSETKEFNKKIMFLRSEKENFGVVLKGLTCLDWSTFIHQNGKFILGEASNEFIEKRTEKKSKIWKYVQSYWIRNAKYAYELINQLAENENVIIEALVEDGMFDKNLWFPVALYGAILWEKDKNIEDILSDTALMPNVIFAN